MVLPPIRTLPKGRGLPLSQLLVFWQQNIKQSFLFLRIINHSATTAFDIIFSHEADKNMLPSKRQRIENVDLSQWQQVFEFLDCNLLLLLRCVAKQFVEPANQYLVRCFDRASEIQQYNLTHAGFLSLPESEPQLDWSKLTKLSSNYFSKLTTISPFTQFLVKQIRMCVDHHTFCGWFVSDLAASGMGYELFKLSRRLSFPINERTVRIVDNPEVMIHQVWHSVDYVERYWLSALMKVASPDSFVLCFDLFYHSSIHNIDAFADFIGKVGRLPKHIRKKLCWPERNCQAVRRLTSAAWKIYLEFFEFDHNSAYFWMNVLNNQYYPNLKNIYPALLEGAFGTGTWIIEAKWKTLVSGVAHFTHTDLETDFSDGTYKKLRQFEKWHVLPRQWTSIAVWDDGVEEIS